MKIFDFSKVMFNVSKGKLVAQKGKLVIPTPINSTNCPTIYTMSGYTKKDSDGKEYTDLDGRTKIPVCMAEKKFYVKKGTFEGEKAFLGVRIYLGNGTFGKQELIGTVEYKDGVVNSDGDLVFTFDFPVFEYNTGMFYYLASYNSDSGEGEQFIQNGYFTKTIVNVSSEEPDPVPPEPTDPIEEYTVQGVSAYFSDDASSSESYTVSWESCEEDWFDENCYYEIVAKHGETILDTNTLYPDEYTATKTTFDVGDDYLDNETYTFEVRVVKYDKKSLPGIATDTYRDPFHDESIDLGESYLYICGDGYELKWNDVCDADKYEVYLDGNLYETTTSNSISISDKDPGDYKLEIKAYNHKNTMISEKTSISLYDPMVDSVSLSLDGDVSYYSNDTIYIPSLNAYYNESSQLPSYIKSRLNNKSLEIFIDGKLVKTQGFTTIDDIDVSKLDQGVHYISFTLTTTYGSSTSSKNITFNVDRCVLKNNSLIADASYDSSDGSIAVNVYFENSIYYTDNLVFHLNDTEVSFGSSSGGSLTINPDDYETYSITPGQENTIHVEVSCKNRNHDDDETLSKDVKLYVNSWMETSSVELEYALINASDSSIPAVNIFVTLGPGCGGNLIAECEEDGVSTYLENHYGMAENEYEGTLEFDDFEYNTEYTKTIKIYPDTNHYEYIESTITFTSPEEPPKDDEY